MPKAARSAIAHSESREQWVRQISGRLLVLREWLDLSEQEMAARLGLSMPAYREYERPDGRTWSDFSFPLKVAAATGVSPDWLIHGSHSRGRPKSRVPLDANGRPMRPVFRVVSGREGRE